MPASGPHLVTGTAPEVAGAGTVEDPRAKVDTEVVMTEAMIVIEATRDASGTNIEEAAEAVMGAVMEAVTEAEVDTMEEEGGADTTDRVIEWEIHSDIGALG